MKSDSQPSQRYTRLRATLVDLPSTSGAIPVKRTRTIIGTAAAAFILGSALTGGAFAAAATVNAGQAANEASAAAAGIEVAGANDAKLLGTPFVVSVTGSTTINLGKAPAGANQLVEVLDRLGSGTWNSTIDGAFATGETCSSAADLGPGASLDPVATSGAHTYAVSTTSSSSYVIWLSWANMPTLTPSPAQKAALSDGVITRAEYVAAFNQYAGCMAAAGYPLPSDVNESASIIQYSTSEAAVKSGADDRCYVTQFKAVAGLWSTEDGGIHDATN